jgi:hypothetical protein
MSAYAGRSNDILESSWPFDGWQQASTLPQRRSESCKAGGADFCLSLVDCDDLCLSIDQLDVINYSSAHRLRSAHLEAC